MIERIQVKEGIQLKDYELYTSLILPIKEMMAEAAEVAPRLKNKKVWMINSTARGGGVAEMMPRMVSILNQLSVSTEWLVAGTDNKDFFALTKKIHNLIHGEGQPYISEEEKLLYEKVNRDNAEELFHLIEEGDIVVIHDPQPMGIAIYLRKKNLGLKLIWRCHIGLDQHTKETACAWKFLNPYADCFDFAIFSAAEYIPGYLTGRSVVIHPSIDPLDHKNRDLTFYKVVGILSNSGILAETHPVLMPPFTEQAKRLQRDGSFQSPLLPSDPKLLFRPLVTQISRFDSLKGFLFLMKGFVELKNNKEKYGFNNARHERRLDLAGLLLAGPDPDFVADDPKGKKVLQELADYFLSLPPEIQKDIIILKLPMSNRKNNEVIVNALQRILSLVAQNSLREGFGLTVTEAMWKTVPVAGTVACGIRQQIRNDIEGITIEHPEDPLSIASVLNEALFNPKKREVWAYNGKKRVIDNFLIFSQIRKWLQLFDLLIRK
jgi:trehalose synthase